MKDRNQANNARGPRIERLALCGAQSVRLAGRSAAPAHAALRLRQSGEACSRHARHVGRILRRA